MFQKIIKWKGFVYSVLAFELLLLLKLQFTAWPEMTLWPYLMIKGWLPYKDIAIAHDPLLLVTLSLYYKVFGLGLIQLKIFTWLVILISFITSFWIADKLWNKKIAALTILFLVPLTIYYDANGLWFDLALTPFFLLTYYNLKRKKYLLAGISWILAFLVKQTAIFLIVPVVWELSAKNIIKNSEKFVLGAFFMLMPFLLLVWIFGLTADYVHWTLGFAGGKLPFSQGQVSFPSIKQLILGWWPYVIMLSIVFVKKKEKYLNLSVWAFFSGLGVYPRWELFHLLPSIAFFAFIFAHLIEDSNKMQKLQKYVIFFGILIFILLSLKKAFLFWDKPTRFFEQDVVSAGNFLRQNTKKNEPVFVLNYWEHLYVLSDTMPATRPWIPQFSWYMDDPGVQEKMLVNLIISSPKYIVYHPYSEKGLDSYKPVIIADYIEKYYQPVGFYSGFEILEKR